MSYGQAWPGRKRQSVSVSETAWTFAKNYSYYCRQSPCVMCNVFSMSQRLLATSLPASCGPFPCPSPGTSRRIGNLIQLSGGKDINSALYCIRSTRMLHVSRSICAWLHCNFNEATQNFALLHINFHSSTKISVWLCTNTYIYIICLLCIVPAATIHTLYS